MNAKSLMKSNEKENRTKETAHGTGILLRDTQQRYRIFTLIELLVVIAIIAI